MIQNESLFIARSSGGGGVAGFLLGLEGGGGGLRGFY